MRMFIAAVASAGIATSNAAVEAIEAQAEESKAKPNEHYGDIYKEIYSPRKERGSKSKGQVKYGFQGGCVGITVVF